MCCVCDMSMTQLVGKLKRKDTKHSCFYFFSLRKKEVEKTDLEVEEDYFIDCEKVEPKRKEDAQIKELKKDQGDINGNRRAEQNMRKT